MPTAAVCDDKVAAEDADTTADEIDDLRASMVSQVCPCVFMMKIKFKA